jgi:hypothetical protein
MVCPFSWVITLSVIRLRQHVAEWCRQVALDPSVSGSLEKRAFVSGR